jgi:ubiquitin carboxyl-terminal hydrolase 48
MFPIHVVDKLVSGGASDLTSVAAHHHDVCILFADVVGFTQMCSEVKPREVMYFLNQLFCVFDSFVAEYSMYKLETIGDCYVAVAGLVKQKDSFFECIDSNCDDDYDEEFMRQPNSALKSNTAMMLDFAATIVQAAYNIRMPPHGKPTEIRVGVHYGNVMSGIVGLKMPRYCLFGDTINVASRMETTCPIGHVHMSQEFYESLPRSTKLGIEPNGPIQIKGKGDMITYKMRVQTVSPTSETTSLTRSPFLDTEYKQWARLLRQPQSQELQTVASHLGI